MEYIMVAAFNGTNSLWARHVGKFNKRLDVEAGKRNKKDAFAYSVKSVFTAPGDIRLVNVLGESSATEWTEPTIFVLAGIGIVYADYLLLPRATKRTRDALILIGQPFKKYARAHPEFLIDIEIPHKSTEKNLSESKTASEDVARILLQRYKKLKLERND